MLFFFVSTSILTCRSATLVLVPSLLVKVLGTLAVRSAGGVFILGGCVTNSIWLRVWMDMEGMGWGLECMWLGVIAHRKFVHGRDLFGQETVGNTVLYIL